MNTKRALMDKDAISEKVSLLETQRLLANRGHYLIKPKLDLLTTPNQSRRFSTRSQTKRFQNED